jgi:hypothetical protein
LILFWLAKALNEISKVVFAVPGRVVAQEAALALSKTKHFDCPPVCLNKASKKGSDV